VILGAMEKDPRKRTASAEAFRRGLVEARESASTGAAGMRILVADDDPDFIDIARETLSFAFPGAEIVTVDNGAEALAAIDVRPFAFALLDLDMPGLNGIELTAAIRSSRSAESMPILVATATGGAPDWKLLSSLGADGFLVKPIDAIALITAARRAVGKRHG
jgi:serine/threonine-protein kinase